MLIEPATPAGTAGLAAVRADPARVLVGLDFDGTLAPIVPDPAQARAHPAVPATLRRLADVVGRIAIVTGRPAELAVELGGLADVPRLLVLGHYGAERWEAGELTAPPHDPGVDAVRAALPALLAPYGPGVLVEDKGRAVAVHTRRAPDPAGVHAALRIPLADLARTHGLALEPGRMVLELRPADVDKGSALRALVAQEGTPGAIVFVGDDLGDLAAFDAVDEFRTAGVPGLLVASGSTEVTELAARADLVVDGPAGVVAFLQALASAGDR